MCAARLNNNGVITKKRLVEIILTEKVDDFVAYCPNYEATLKELEKKVKWVMDDIASELDVVEDGHYFTMPRADFAKAIKNFKYKHFLFGTYDGKFKSVKNYVFSMRPEQLLRLLEEE